MEDQAQPVNQDLPVTQKLTQAALIAQHKPLSYALPSPGKVAPINHALTNAPSPTLDDVNPEEEESKETVESVPESPTVDEEGNQTFTAVSLSSTPSAGILKQVVSPFDEASSTPKSNGQPDSRPGSRNDSSKKKSVSFSEQHDMRLYDLDDEEKVNLVASCTEK